MGFVSIQSELCKACYSCVRNCPVKAIKVENGKAHVIEERCLSCGSCLKVCSQNAKVVLRDLDRIKGFLKNNRVVALLAPSFPASFPGIPPQALHKALMEIGFRAVHDVTIGIEATVPLYQKYLSGATGPLISTYCPAIVGLVTKYYPDLVQYLAPIDSAVNAAGKIVAKEYPGSRVVFIGPCLAKKEEVSKYGSSSIDAVMTFKELKELFKENGLTLAEAELTKQEEPYIPQEFPVSGGLLKNLGLDLDESLIVDGAQNCLEALDALRTQREKPRFLDILFCKGCIDGPEVDSPLDLYGRIRAVRNNAKIWPRDPLAGKHEGLSFKRVFEPHPLPAPVPSEQQIKEILKFTYKYTPEDELNCGACGYATCRDKAVAVYQGLADIDMCLPYLINKSRGETKYYKDQLQTILRKKQEIHFIGEHHSVIEIRRLAEKASKNKLNVILQGEKGVGKSLLAHYIHSLSLPKNRPFFEVDCANSEQELEAELFGSEEMSYIQGSKIKKVQKSGKLDKAQGGVIFLKHVEEMPLSVQAKLATLLQEKIVYRTDGSDPIRLQVRFIASTRVDLRPLIVTGEFRADLFYKLNGVYILVPPLRERKTDIPLLTGYFLEKVTVEKKLPPKVFSEFALQLLQRYHWPGNVRELYNAVEKIAYLSEEALIGPEQIPESMINVPVEGLMEVPLFNEAIAKLEKDLISRALRITGNNRVRAAKLLGIPRATLYLKIKEYQIDLGKSQSRDKNS